MKMVLEQQRKVGQYIHLRVHLGRDFGKLACMGYLVVDQEQLSDFQAQSRIAMDPIHFVVLDPEAAAAISDTSLVVQ